MQIELQFLQGPWRGKKFTFSEYAKISIGREPNAYFSFPADKKMSRFHCLIEISPPANCFVKDLGSTNGTFVSHEEGGQEKWQQINEAYLTDGDCVKAGENVLRLLLPPQATVPPQHCDQCGKPAELADCGGEAGSRPCTFCGNGETMGNGKKFGNFEIVNKLGEGGMGVVYLVRHTSNQQLFALKIARPTVPPNQTQIDRFLREASCGVKIHHPHIVRYYMAGYAPAGFFYIPMEYVPGTNFAKYMEARQRPLMPAEAREPLLQFLDALICLHSHHIVHRDIKPSNLLVTEQNGRITVKLSDFGLAKNYVEAGLSGITLSNQMIGTPEYIAPEQLQNSRDVDPRADIYSAAATIYFLLTDRTIYSESDPAHMAAKILLHEVKPICDLNPLVPSSLGEAIMRCLRKEPKDRLQTVTALRQAVASSGL
jgi:serine/threonine-protein kinase